MYAAIRVMLRADMFVFAIRVCLCNWLFGPLYRTACYYSYKDFFVHRQTAPSGPRHPHCWGSDITPRHTTLGRAPLDEWSARLRDLYIKTHNTQQESDIHAHPHPPRRDSNSQSLTSQRPQIRTVDRAVSGIGTINLIPVLYIEIIHKQKRKHCIHNKWQWLTDYLWIIN